MGGSGQVYVLDMGEPVKILDLARQMIELSGRTEEQIAIAFVGSRAGEKLHEELWNDGEDGRPDQAPEDHARRAGRRSTPTGSTTSSPSSSASSPRATRSASTTKLQADGRRARSASATPVLEDTLH